MVLAMKNVHYRNIGFPKTGTTWLWSKLMQNPDVDCKINHLNRYQNKEFRAKTLSDYKKQYEKYVVSINFDTHIFFVNLKINILI